MVAEPPPPGAGLLLDETHECRAAASGDMMMWLSALAAARITVDRLTSGPVTAAALQQYRAFAVVMPRVAYAAAEV